MSAQLETGRMNCAGQGCRDREGCRRYRVMIHARGADREHPHGAWGSFDVEKRRMGGDCPAFVQYRGNR